MPDDEKAKAEKLAAAKKRVSNDKHRASFPAQEYSRAHL
jgi:hypothetical protein